LKEDIQKKKSIMKYIVSFVLVLVLSLNAVADVMQPWAGQSLAAGFIENKGQVRNQHGKPNTGVKYVFHRNGFNLELTQAGFSYELFTAVPDEAMDEAGFAVGDIDGDETKTYSRLSSSHRVDVELAGANQNAVVVASAPLQTVFNFYYSAETRSSVENVKAFSVVTYQNIYPGIDLVFYSPAHSADSRLKYEFVVHPGADASAIHLKYHGAEIQAQPGNQLLVAMSNGFVREEKLMCYLAGSEKEIAASLLLEANSTRIQLGSYDKKQTLVIDPSIVWGTYYGGPNTEDVADMAINSSNEPTVAGNTLSEVSIATEGAYQTTFSGGFHDFFVAKFDATANIKWATYLGGTERDLGFGVEVDELGQVYFNGKTTSDGIATDGAYQTIRGGNDDAVIAKLDQESGALLWLTYFGGEGNEQFRAFEFDDNNNFYVCGYTESATGVATPGAFQTVYGGEGDAMISKWTADGEVIWSTYYGAAGQDRYHSISIDPFDKLYCVGTTSSTTGVVTAGTYQTTYGGGSADLWLGKFTLDGALIWSTFYGGEVHDRGRGVETDSMGNIYVVGFTASSTGISTPGALQEEWSEGYDSQTSEPLDDNLLFSMTADGVTRLWGTYYGGGAKEELWGMNLDRKRKCIYLVGSTQSNALISYGNAWQPEKGKGSDAVFARWNYDGSIVYGSYFGKDKGEQFEDVELDANGDIYLVGKTEENQLPATYGVYQTYSNGGQYEGVIYKFYGGVACRDIREPNNSFANASVIYARTLADSAIYGYDGNLRNGSDKDYFKVTVTSDYKNLMIILNGLDHNYDLRVYNSAQILKAQSKKGGLTPDTIIANKIQAGDYYIQVFAGNPAEYDTMRCYHLDLLKSMTKFPTYADGAKKESAQSMNRIFIYPNPASEEISMDVTSDSDRPAKLIVKDLYGKIVLTQTVTLAEGLQTVSVPLAALAPGFYQVIIAGENFSSATAFVKQ
jgi:hypothetical protein